MSWPSTDFEVEIQTEIDALREVAQCVNALLRAKDKGPREEALRSLKRAYEYYEAVEPADI